jgi:hypothetical protein
VQALRDSVLHGSGVQRSGGTRSRVGIVLRLQGADAGVLPGRFCAVILQGLEDISGLLAAHRV